MTSVSWVFQGTQCNQAEWFRSQCAFPAPDPPPLLVKAIQQTAVDDTLIQSLGLDTWWKEDTLLDMVHVSRNSWPGEEIQNHPSTMHSFNWHLLNIYYTSVTDEHAEPSEMSRTQLRTQLSPQSRAEGKHNSQQALAVWLGQRRGMCPWSLERRGWVTRNGMARVTSTTNETGPWGQSRMFSHDFDDSQTNQWTSSGEGPTRWGVERSRTGTQISRPLEVLLPKPTLPSCGAVNELATPATAHCHPGPLVRRGTLSARGWENG